MTVPRSDKATFRAQYNLPSAQEYLDLLRSSDQQGGIQLVTREQAAIAQLRQEGFSGSTLSEAFAWWSAQKEGGDSCPEQHSCDAAGCHCH